MNTRLLMTSSAAFLALVGLAASFVPEELLWYVGSPAQRLEVLIVQMVGAAYMGFAILNWTARENLIGGIYSRPVALGNFLNFGVVAIAITKVLMGGESGIEVIIGAVAYTGFAVAFGFVLFTHPGRARDSSQ